MVLKPGHVLSHFRLVEQIGKGGMGIVWKALDTRLDRNVALKVLPAEFLGDESRKRRFVREARTAAALSHPNIAAVHEIDEVDGLTFIVSDLVEGETLRSLLGRGPLPLPDLLKIAVQMAAGLARAHEARIVHRDLKPENVMVGPDKHVRILDFGLAKPLETREEASEIEASQATTVSHELTREGNLIGTAAYMSPEQARGLPVDTRSDIFSLGATIYEMATGRMAFRGKTPTDTLAAVIGETPPPASRLNQGVPEELSRILSKCMEKDPRQRYQNTPYLTIDLQRLAKDLDSGPLPQSSAQPRAGGSPLSRLRGWRGIALGSVLVVAAVSAWFVGSRATTSLGSRVILIVPPEVRGQQSGAEYAGRAFAEALALNLAQSPSIEVLPLPDDRELEGLGSLERTKAAARFGATDLLSGSLIRDGDSMRASMTIVDTSRNRIVWGTQKLDSGGSLSSLSASIAKDVIGKLTNDSSRRYDFVLNLTGGPEMAAAPETAETLGALWRFELKKALDASARLIGRFPRESDALALRACALFYGIGEGLVTMEQLEDGLEAVARLDPLEPTPQNIRCELFNRKHEWESAIACADSLLAREDLTPAARAWPLRDKAAALLLLGRTDEAVAAVKTAVSLDPTNHFNFKVLGWISSRSGDLDGAEKYFQQAFSLAPGDSGGPLGLARVRRRRGDFSGSAEILSSICRSQHAAWSCAELATDLLKAGRPKEADGATEEASSLYNEQPTPDAAYALARVWALRSDAGKSITYLRAASEMGPMNQAKILAEEDFHSLRGNPDFDAFVSNLGQDPPSEEKR